MEPLSLLFTLRGFTGTMSQYIFLFDSKWKDKIPYLLAHVIYSQGQAASQLQIWINTEPFYRFTA